MIANATDGRINDLCRDAMPHMRRHAARYAELVEDIDDLVQNALLRFFPHAHEFDPAIATLGTFSCQFVDFAAKDMMRAGGRRKRVSIEHVGGQNELAHLALLCQLKCYSSEGRRGRPPITDQQRRAIREMAKKLGAGAYGIRRILRRNPEVRKALGLKRAPARWTIARILAGD